MTEDEESRRRLAVTELRRQFERAGTDYAKSMFAASVMFPHAGSVIWTAQQHRLKMIQLPQLVRLTRGIENLFALLIGFHQAFVDSNDLTPIAFLVERLLCDYQATYELSLSGLFGSAVDTLRDTMEIEHLLNDFAHEPSHIQEWLTASTRRERKQFDPVKLREREADRQKRCSQEDLQTSADYKMHSESLHISRIPAFARLKGVHEFDETFSLFPIYEIYFHGASTIKVLLQFGPRFDEVSQEKLANLVPTDFFRVRDEVANELERIRSSL